MGAEAPQWLVGAFVDALGEVGATADREARVAEANGLIELWNAPGRSAHNVRHLIHVLTLIDELADAAHDADVLRVTAWYHGACMTRSYVASSDAQAIQRAMHTCADLTRVRLEALGTPGEVVDRVLELLDCAVTHRAPADDSDAQVLVDADLGRLALSPQEFSKYRECLRDECSNLDDVAYCRARRHVIMDLLSRDSIFYTDHASAWEEVARSNLELELARIDDRLQTLCPEALASDAPSSDDEAAAAPLGESAAGSATKRHAYTPEHDEDLISDDCVHATHAKVIKARQVKPANSDANDELVTTGVLPAINALVDDADPSEAPSRDDSDSHLSSLESAVDTLGLV